VIFAETALQVESDALSGKATFQVSRVWRGSVPVSLSTSNTWDCDSVFRIGEEYLVFAHKIEHDDAIGYDLIASRCGQTRPLIYSKDVLAVLGLGWPPEEHSAEKSIWIKVSVGATLVLVVLLILLFKVVAARKRRNSRFALN
jgi:hypothetical protein